MYLEVYIDVIFLINYIMDLLLLFIVKIILKRNTTRLKLYIAALIGAISSCILAIIPQLNGLLQFILSYIIIAYLMVLVAFGQQNTKTRMKACIVLYISTFFLGGVLNSLYYTFGFGDIFKELFNGGFLTNRTATYYLVSIITAMGAIYIFIKILMNLRSGALELYETYLHFNDKSIKLMGLLDTGNSLYDPILKKPVLITEYNVIKSLFSDVETRYIERILYSLDRKFTHNSRDEIAIHKDTSAEVDHIKIRMVPYHSIGKSGILPAIEINQVVIWDREEKIKNEKVLIGISGTKISKYDEYQIILHRDVM